MPDPQDAVILSLLFQLERSQWWPPDLLLAHQLWQVQVLIGHAARTVPLYEERLGEVANLVPGALTYDAFLQLPILRRADVQAAGERFVSREIPASHGNVVAFQTSGSTGLPLKARKTDLTKLFSSTLGLRYHLWHGRDLAAKNLTIKTVDTEDPSAEHSWAPCYPTGCGRVYDISQPVAVLLDRLRAEDPEYLQVHPSTLRGMIQRSRELGWSPRSLREVRTFGEVLDEDLRDICRKEWDLPISDNYSSEETGIIALQCPGYSHYHVQAESILVEVLDADGQPCAPGEVGRVVGTPLHNFANPFIRYELGDLAEVGAPCSCGRGLPVLNRIFGRVRHLVTLPSGETLHPVFREERILAAAPVRQYQLIQKTLDTIEVNLVTARPLSTQEEAGLGDYFSESFRHRFDYRFQYKQHLPMSAGGKFEIFRSEVAGPRVA